MRSLKVSKKALLVFFRTEAMKNFAKFTGKLL